MRTTNAVLSQEQEEDLIEYLRQRLVSLRVDNQERILADKASWLAYENNADCRKVKGTIFHESNIHLPVTSMVVDYFLGRAEDQLPQDGMLFNFRPVGASDRPRAEAYNHYFNWKVDAKGGAGLVLRDGLTAAFVQRAAIFKATFDKDARRWVDRDRRILYDRTTGQQVLVPGRGPVIEGEDQWVSAPDPIAAEVALSAASVGAMPPEIPQRVSLAADPTVVWDGNRYEWRLPPGGLKREEVLYAGPRSVQVEYDRFLCPANVESIEAADVVAELDEKPLSFIKTMWLERPWCSWADYEANAQHGTAKEKLASDKQSKENLSFDDKDPMRKIVIFWVRRDVMGWGAPQDLCVFWDEEADKAIWYEFVAKICPDFKRPYTAVAIGKAKNRWWGKSMPEKVAQYQEKIDELFNAEAHRQKMNANPIKVVDWSVVEDEEEDLVFSPDKYYRAKGGKFSGGRGASDFVSFAAMPNLDGRTRDNIEFLLAMIREWLHVHNIASSAALDSSKSAAAPETATGIEAQVDESQTMARRWDRRIISAYIEHVQKLVQIAMATLPDNQEEAYRVTEGDAIFSGKITGKDIRGMDIDVRLAITPRLNRKKREAAVEALNAVQGYLAQPDDIKPFVRDPYLEILKSLGYREADKMVPLVATTTGLGGATQPSAKGVSDDTSERMEPAKTQGQEGKGEEVAAGGSEGGE